MHRNLSKTFTIVLYAQENTLVLLKLLIPVEEKGVVFHIFSSVYLDLRASDYKNLLSNPYNPPLIMGDGHKNFKDLMLSSQDTI